MSEGRWLLRWALAAFVGAGALLLVLAPRLRPTVGAASGFAVAEVAVEEQDGWSTVTIDVSSRAAWRGFSFELGRPVPAGPAADLYLRRYQLRAPAGARSAQAGAWTRDAAQFHWYRYSLLANQLVSRGNEYAVRPAAGGGPVAVRIVSYYCAGGEPGCLTLRYRPAPPRQANR